MREIRERQGLTLEEIAEETKINCRFLRAIEEEAWEDLPGEVYVRGYLRAYAEAVGLDPGEVLARYSERRLRPENECGTATHHRRLTVSGYLIGAVILLILAMVFYLMVSHWH
ncbi:helix-turn-helix transcriptional regulator [Thermosulfurimonas sp. F29]|uniref:helix-turn-helix domain-containing protein n=1 Tax=Thermosulfurimonas sp. F29 TaxID=2867247 RepID=UPI001C8377EF|nr:helix-turn-helix domain-containing protein [Thermosulfurimonas sp. F29]MBX6422698.1 helix-turn-helix domain-containing protein [Thermosulfurimonas sp. F29]